MKVFGCNVQELRQSWGLTGGEYDTKKFYEKLYDELHRKHYQGLDHLNVDEYRWLDNEIKTTMDGLSKDN